MISQCPHCNQSLNLKPAQIEKVENALDRLQSGSLKLNCPHCNKSMELGKDGSLAGSGGTKQKIKGAVSKLSPPAPPDLKWLASTTTVGEGDEIKDIPMALFLMKEGDLRDSVAGSFIELFYQPVYAETAEQAMGKMRFVNFSAVILHSGFEGGSLENSVFHKYMKNMAMSRRRYIYYVLVGPDFHTLYDLEALANSANLVVNEKEVDYLKTIVKKGQADYEALFGSWLAALKGHGNK
ncbi:MAG: hypothetical protein KKE17_03920 [Proteobacteria bacterium]|nr:hypothetical protein [Pseudomonadota bacterium]MBU1709132.1 hypothetical protein [Pseudomonadota bacterium]